MYDTTRRYVPSEQQGMISSDKQDDVFRKKFHIPSEWKKNAYFKDLIEHKYAISNTKQAFTYIEQRLKALGYMEDNNEMVHDYLYYMIQDMLIENKEVFITENIITREHDIKCLLNNSTPDFVIKRGNGRQKTLIIDIYVGEKDINEIKGKYRKLELFADFKIITPANFRKELKIIFKDSDLDYLYKNYQIFLIEYHYWKACMKLKKILFNEEKNIEIITFSNDRDKFEVDQLQYVETLKHYASSVLAQEDI